MPGCHQYPHKQSVTAVQGHVSSAHLTLAVALLNLAPTKRFVPRLVELHLLCVFECRSVPFKRRVCTRLAAARLGNHCRHLSLSHAEGTFQVYSNPSDSCDSD